jgi:serine/threonine protein kinase
MPDLGVSINAIESKKEELRKIPIPIIMDQVIKVLQQVQTLQASGYIHGDIRDTNIMIHPTTGTITIIDFDLLKEANRFNPNGMYNNPPECMLLGRPERYVPTFYRYFNYVQDLYNSDEFSTEMSEAVERNRLFTERAGKSSMIKKFLATFDSFGLACTLLCLFRVLYPGSVRHPKASLRTALGQRATKYGTPYTEPELDACTNAIYDMTRSVLLLLSKFRMEHRPNVDGVLETAISIQRELNERMAGTMVGNRVGGRRKTRKTTKTRKSVHRQKK